MTRRRRRRAAVVVVAALVAAGSAAGWRWVSDSPLDPVQTVSLDEVRIVAVAPSIAGYDRSCSPGDGCVFGPAWSDDVSVDGGHNGCDTRSDQLQLQMRQLEFKPGSRGCVVLSGILDDPYTGHQVRYVRGQRPGVDLDHTYPLSVAWDRGAANWSIERRRDLANDPRGLILTAAGTNRSKSDAMPDQWQPPTGVGQCLYASRIVEIAATYELPLTITEARSVRSMLTNCSN